jgi:hypothetical protein
MTLNASGPISIAGTTAGQSIQIELNGNGTTQMSLNDAAVRTLAGVPSGAITMPTNFYGKSNRVTAAATISANTSNYTVNTAKAPGYAAGTTDFTLTINSNIFVSSTSTGSYAITVDTSWAPGDTVAIINNGTIVGRGGGGGTGAGTAGNNSSPGGSAGPALIVNRAVTFNNTNGRIAGGGGGGGGGKYGYNNDPPVGKSSPISVYSGPGGGGGIGNGAAGAAGPINGGPGSLNSGNPGSAGTLTAAGSGGASIGLSFPTGTGGTGGGYGSSGSPSTGGFIGPQGSGGAAGAAIVGNSSITYTPGGNGTRNGSIS